MTTTSQRAAGTALEIVATDDASTAEHFRAAGACPVECAFGPVSVVDELRMDHHGDLADLEPVALRAWRDHHGARREDPWFVVAGTVDADAAFAIAALAGLVPGPDDEGNERAAQLVDLIALLDIDPIGRDLTAQPAGGLLRLWSSLAGPATPEDNLAAVLAWRSLCLRDQQALAPYVEVAEEQERRRRRRAADDAERCRVLDDLDPRVLVLDGTTTWGFDVWYGRRPDQPSDQPAGWSHPVVLARSGRGQVTVGCPNGEVATALFGAGGLAAVFPKLAPPGWGGRPTVGGAPRGHETTSAELRTAAQVIAGCLRPEEGSAQPDP
ncbi:MAG: hypothetical protein ACLFV0_04760 [Nitriliruptoraceae bacterium]